MRNYYKTNSHYLTYTSSLKNVGRMYFLSLGVKGLKGCENVTFWIWECTSVFDVVYLVLRFATGFEQTDPGLVGCVHGRTRAHAQSRARCYRVCTWSVPSQRRSSGDHQRGQRTRSICRPIVCLSNVTRPNEHMSVRTTCEMTYVAMSRGSHV